MPITAAKSESRKFFFWYWPVNSTSGGDADSITIWLNGGPGCSSLEGMLQENGPVTIEQTSENVTVVARNEYSWHKLSNMLWVEQPVSVGLGEGTPTAINEHGIAKQFYGFLTQFYSQFPELKTKKLWITGESYAGQYIPYIVDYIYKQEQTFNLQGFAVNDPSIVNDDFGEEIPAYDFAVANQKALGLNSSNLAQLRSQAKQEGTYGFVQKNLVFPPKGKVYAPSKLPSATSIWNMVLDFALQFNPCFSYYEITLGCPSLDALGYPLAATARQTKSNFINDTPGLKAYIHADPNRTWYECTENNVFASQDGIDHSPHPADTPLLGSVIDKSKRAVIQHGLRDFVLIANGTLLGIQNTTWAGKQGFQTSPFATTGNLIVEGTSQGSYHTERGLTYATIDASGHMIPQFAPAAAYKLQKFLLGQISSSDLGKKK